MFPLLSLGQQAGSQRFSLEKEAALGEQLSRDVRARTTTVGDEQVQQYVGSVVRRLVSQAPSWFPWTIEVVSGLGDRPPYEPLSIPGGYIFVSVDLLLTAQSKREFAGMLAHSLAHQVFGMLPGSFNLIPQLFLRFSSIRAKLRCPKHSGPFKNRKSKQPTAKQLKFYKALISTMRTAGFN